jgi:hypothetical protein
MTKFEHKFKLNLIEIYCKIIYWIQLALHKVHCWPSVIVVIFSLNNTRTAE